MSKRYREIIIKTEGNKLTIEINKSEFENLQYKLKQTNQENSLLSNKVKQLEEKINQLTTTIESELNPRIEAEKRAYDFYVSTDRSLEAEGRFEELVEELRNMVLENPEYFEWEDIDGDLVSRVLWEIKKGMQSSRA